MQRRTKPQTFNSGLCSIYAVSNAAPAAGKPIESLALKAGALRYHQRTMGITRLYAAKQANTRVDMLLRVARLKCVSTQDVAILEDGQQYRIEEIQYPEDIMPPVMDLTLKRTVQKYDIS